MSEKKKTDDGSDLLILLVIVIIGIVLFILAIINLLIPIALTLGTFFFFFTYQKSYSNNNIRNRRYILTEEILSQVKEYSTAISINDGKVFLLEKQLELLREAKKRNGEITAIKNRIAHIRKVNKYLDAMLQPLYASRQEAIGDIGPRYCFLNSFLIGTIAYFYSAYKISGLYGIKISQVIPLLDIKDFQLFAIYEGAIIPVLIVIGLTILAMAIAYAGSLATFGLLHVRRFKVNLRKIKLDLDSTETEDFVFEEDQEETKQGSNRGEEGKSYKEQNQHRSKTENTYKEPKSRLDKYLAILEVEQGSELTPSSLKKRYYDLLAKYHPDKVSHLGVELIRFAEEKTKQINEAYDYILAYIKE